MTKQEALQILIDATAILKITRQEHKQVEDALVIVAREMKLLNESKKEEAENK